MLNGKTISETRKRLKLSVPKLADKLGISADNLYKWEKGTKITDLEAYRKLENWLKEMENVPHGTKNAPVDRFQADTDRSVKYVGEVLEKRKDSNLESLIESNRMMAAAMLADAESRAMLTKSNAELTLMVRQSVNVRPETSEALTAILPGLQKILIEFGMGRLWKNQREGQLKVSRWLFGSQQKVSAGHIHDDLGK